MVDQYILRIITILKIVILIAWLMCATGFSLTDSIHTFQRFFILISWAATELVAILLSINNALEIQDFVIKNQTLQPRALSNH